MRDDGDGKGMRGSPVTIQDVARIAGVSTATVSRTLHNPDIVSERTRARVQQAVDDTGYAGNAMARSLRRMETRMIVVLVPNIGNPFFSEILSGIEASASAAGYNILIGDTNNDPAKERTFAGYVRGHQADGMLLLNGRPPYFAADPASVDHSELPPVVVLCERLPEHRFPTVTIDNEGAAREATAYLTSLGHRRIAHIKGPGGNILTAERLAGYEAALRQAGIPGTDGFVQAGDFSINSGRHAARRLLALPRPPTAVFCANDEMAIGAIVEFKAAGHSVPDRVSVVGFDDIQFAGSYEPPLTTIRQPRRLIGETAMQLMIERLSGKYVSGGDRVLPAELVVRGSTVAPDAGSAGV